MDNVINFYLDKLEDRKIVAYSKSIGDIAGYKTLVEDETSEDNRVWKRDPEVALPSTGTENGEQNIDLGQVGFRSSVDGFNPDFKNDTYLLKYRTIPHEEYEIPYKADYGYLTRRSLTSSSILGVERRPPEKWNDIDSDNDGSIESPEGTTVGPGGISRYPKYNNEDNKTQASDLYVGEVYNNPGSGARVIPYSSEAQNSSWSESRFAKTIKGDGRSIRYIRNKLNKLVKTFSKRRTVSKWEVLGVGNVWKFTVEGDGNVYVVNLTSLNREDDENYITFTEDTEVRVSCPCGFWKWAGPDYWADKYGYIYGEPRSNKTPPKKRDPGGINRICKHVESVFNYVLREGTFPRYEDSDRREEKKREKSEFEERSKREVEKEIEEIRSKGREQGRDRRASLEDGKVRVNHLVCRYLSLRGE